MSHCFISEQQLSTAKVYYWLGQFCDQIEIIVMLFWRIECAYNMKRICCFDSIVVHDLYLHDPSQ